MDEVRFLVGLAEQYTLPEDDGLHPELHDHGVSVGDLGLPKISEFLSLEVGALLGISTRKATTMIVESLHLRHGLPSLWRAADELRIDVDRALRAAGKCSQLSREVAERVVKRWLRIQHKFSWAGAFKKLDEIIIDESPLDSAEAERSNLDGRHFFIRQAVHGTVDVHANLDVLDAQLLRAAVSRMAEVLASVEGDEDLLSVRESKALGVLAQPAYALALLQKAAQQPLVPAPDFDPSDEIARERFHTATHGAPRLPLPDEDPAGHDSCLGRLCGRITEPLETLRHPVELHVHIDASGLPDGGVARIERAGAVTTETLRWLLMDRPVRVHPVIDLPTLRSQNGYRPSDRMRAAITSIFPTEPFPFSTNNSRRLELDHTVAFTAAGPPGQTGVGNLAPLTTRVHRAKTAGHWQLEQPEPGVMVWRSPLGFRYRVAVDSTEVLS